MPDTESKISGARARPYSHAAKDEIMTAKSPEKLGTTELGRAVRATISGKPQTGKTPHEHHDTSNSLRDVILGGQDGLVNTHFWAHRIRLKGKE